MEEEHLLCHQLTVAVNESLSNHIYSNATFFAERLMAERDDEENRNLLAKCFMAENKFYKVFHLLQHCRSEGNRYLFALACLKLNKAKEAEKSLTSERKEGGKYDHVPNGSYGVFLLGQAYEKLHFFTEAKECFCKALEMNPLLWTAFEKCCKMGESFSPIKAFSDVKVAAFYEGTPARRVSSKGFSPRKDDSESLLSHSLANREEASKKSFVFGEKRNMPQGQPTPMKLPKKGEIHSGRKPLLVSSPAIKDISTLLKRIGEPFHTMSIYMCKEAVEGFNRLPSNHLRSAWVLMNIGRCLMEMTNYSEAEKYFAEAFKLEPWRLEGLEYYSSCLWHLKKSVELSTLAYSALEKSVFAAEPWIAVGNCFSLLKEHETSLKFLQRALQINPHSAYLHALCGHEYVYNEDFQKAKKCFETSLNLDLRNYNAWWGLGNLFFKQEKHDKAADHFRRALSINGRLPVLHTYLGMTLATKKEFQDALRCFDNAEMLDPNNVLNRYQKCSTLVQLSRFEEALAELEKLRLMVPKEAPIPIMMGKVYKKLGMVEKAQFYFNLALDLETKDSQRIKGYIENLHMDNSMAEEYEN